MPRKNNNARVSAKPRRSSAAAAATTTATPATTATARTAAEDKLWEALRASSGATTADLALRAGIGKSTAAKFLAAWAAEGSVERTPNASGGRRTADRWTIPTSAETPADTPPSTDTGDETPDVVEGITESSADTEDPPTAATDAAATPEKASRLGKGALRGMVEDFLRANPGKEFSPNAIGKALDRSSGAVFNALVKLVGDGYAVQTQDKPKRFTLKPEN